MALSLTLSHLTRDAGQTLTRCQIDVAHGCTVGPRLSSPPSFLLVWVYLQTPRVWVHLFVQDSPSMAKTIPGFESLGEEGSLDLLIRCACASLCSVWGTVEDSQLQRVGERSIAAEWWPGTEGIPAFSVLWSLWRLLFV